MIDLNTFKSLAFFFDLTHIHNFGISFGLFSNSLPSWVFIIVSIIITIIIFFMMMKTKFELEKWGFILIISGALSNIVDRFINGFVIDFIYLHYNHFYWPAFNFADIYISIGVVIIVLQFLKDLNKKVLK